MLTLAGCGAAATGAPGSDVRGRYAGLGAYPPGRLWSRIAAPERPSDPSAATTSDDEHVIVVVDSVTGQVRECGDYSGVCVAFDPWSGRVGKGHSSPVILTRHLAELEPAQGAPAKGEARIAP